MGKQSEQYRQLSREELSQLAGEELPERAAMMHAAEETDDEELREKEQATAAVQAAQPRGAQRDRRRRAAGACRDVADQRERGRPDQRCGRGERPLGQFDRVRECGADRQHHAGELGAPAMSKQSEYRALTREELNTLAGEELPERAAMS